MEVTSTPTPSSPFNRSESISSSPTFPDDEKIELARITFDEKVTMEKPWPRKQICAPRWSLLSALWILSIIATAAWFSYKKPVSPYSYETGFDTDLGEFNM